MNIYLLDLFFKWLSFLVISISSLIGTYSTQSFIVHNNNFNTTKTGEVINYTTQTIYDNTLPTGEVNVITEGVNGYVVTKEDGSIEVLEQMVPEVLEVGTGYKASYVGKITNYGPDCLGCSSQGYVACKTMEGQYLSLFDTIYYDDHEYGDVRILAATHTVFPCGSIILVSRDDVMFYGVVLDTGSAMRNAWNDDRFVIMDLAHYSQYDAKYDDLINGYNVTYEVKRWGW